jgi:hypothetical protein
MDNSCTLGIIQPKPSSAIFPMRLSRYHAFEFNDQSWYPQVLRNGFNDVVEFVHRFMTPYQRASTIIAPWAHKIGTQEIVDFASASAHHLKNIIKTGHQSHLNLPQFIASDLYPAVNYWHQVQSTTDDKSFQYINTPIDMLAPPSGLPRTWSIFTAFHHLSPDQARQFLKTFTENADGLCIGEYLQRDLYSFFMIFAAIPTWFIAPFMADRPSVGKFVLTFIIPIIPLQNLWDGLVSVLRTYTVDEIRTMLPADVRDQFMIEQHKIPYGFGPMYSTITLITRRSAIH